MSKSAERTGSFFDQKMSKLVRKNFFFTRKGLCYDRLGFVDFICKF